MRLIKGNPVKSGLLFFLLSPILIFFTANFIFPLPDPYEGKGFARVVLDSDGRPLRYFADGNGVLRYHVDISGVSPKYIEALIGYEDRFFYYHPGVNPFSLVRSAYQYVSNRKIVSGGSTITMQVARLIDPHKRSVPGKIKQIFRAFQLELYYTKDEILELYLNFAPFGGNLEGVQAASYTYFDCDIADINYSQAALLAVLPQAPSRLRPDRHPGASLAAKNKLAIRMLNYGYWDAETVNDILLEPVLLTYEPRPLLAPIFAERLIRENPDVQVIHTFINRELQQFVEHLILFESYGYPPGTSAAVIVIDNRDNSVVCYAGSIDYGNMGNFGYFDMVNSVRSPGSALKPFIYAMALDKWLIHSKSLLIDAPRVFSNYKAGNFHQTFSGAVSADNALQKSLNVPVVQLLEHISPDFFYSSVINTGAKLSMLGGKPNLSLALGGGGIRLDDLAMLYTAFANEGFTSPLLYSKLDTPEEKKFFFTPEAAYIVYEILRSQYRHDHLFHRDITGTENRLAWKTGTSYGFRDALAIGVTKDYTIAVWVGKPDNTPYPGHFGAIAAAPLLFRISDYVETGSHRIIEKPDGVEEVDICWPSGLAAVSVERKDCHKLFKALTISGVTPSTLSETPGDSGQTYLETWLESSSGKRVTQECGVDFTLKTAHVWPRLTEPWLPAVYRRSVIIPGWDRNCGAGNVLHQGNLIITGISDKSTLVSASIEEGMLPEIMLKAAGGVGKIDWYLNGNFVGDTFGNSSILYQLSETGTYQLVAVDETSAVAEIIFYVD